MSDEQRLASVPAAYAAAVAARDLNAFLSLYDPDVCVFDAWDAWSYEGRSAWGIAIQGWFASLVNVTVRVTFDDVSVVTGKDLAILRAIVTYANTAADGTLIGSLQNRITWGLLVTAVGIRIVHEHTSVPVAFGEGKAILQRKKTR